MTLAVLQLNLWVMYFVYGLSFYTMGIAIAFQYRSYSNFRLAYSLKLLAVFGILHGISEWGNVFIPVQASSLDLVSVWKAIAIQRVLQSISLLFLFCFGTKLIIDSGGRSKWWFALPITAFLGWLVQFTLFIPFLDINELAHWLLLSESWARYLLALPAGVFTAYGLTLQIPEARKLHGNSVYDLWIATISFCLFALFSGLVVPNQIGWLSGVINVQNFWQHIGLPIEIFRTFTALMVTWSITRTLTIFDLEKQWQITESRRWEAVCRERERFARDLHDDVIQSVYGIGLELQSTLSLIKKDQDQAVNKVKSATQHLNGVIMSLRAYIEDLTLDIEHDFQTLLTNMIEQFRQQTCLDIELKYELKKQAVVNSESEVPEGWQRQLIQIAHEALTNIVQHAGASKALVCIRVQDSSLLLVIKDNGKGISGESQSEPDRQHRGLGNMQTRANLLGGNFTLSSEQDSGTELLISVPLVKERKFEIQGGGCYGKNKGANCR
jgi:signal transduction histidine kinase